MDEKRERILKVAEIDFARFGIKKTTMDEIAKKARMGKSTLYYYFKSKEELFAEVIRKDSQLFKLKLSEAMLDSMTPQEKMKSYVQTRMKHLRELKNYYTTLTDEYIEHYVFVEKTRKDFNDYELTILTKLLAEGIIQNIFEVDEIEITARNLAICLKGLEYPLLSQNGNSGFEKVVDQFLNILFKGIEKR